MTNDNLINPQKHEIYEKHNNQNIPIHAHIKQCHPTTKTCMDILNWFSYHPPKKDQPPRFEEIRKEAIKLASKIISITPESEEQKIAIQKLRECVMFANAAIACNEVENAD